MTERFPIQLKKLFHRHPRLGSAAIAATLALSILVNPASAADPFRSSQPRNIGDKTEIAFKAIFLQGNYSAADRLVNDAISHEPNEPLAYAMKASLGYLNQDVGVLDRYSKKTLEIAEKLIPNDPLRGNLYAAVGNFLEAGVILSREGTVNGVPQALNKLREVYKYLDQAEAVSATDPELNLIKGYMDLMLAVNLPFANPDQAIERLEKNAGPQYLVYRGIALAYRDLKQYDRALEYANKALIATADNPEIYYLKAQIQQEKAKKDKNQRMMQEAIANFDKALGKKSQLPTSLVKQIESELRNAKNRLAEVGK